MGLSARAAQFGRVRLLVLDVDGVLTDAGMYYSESGDELKKFNTRDGHGIRMLQDAGVPTAIVTRERTAIVSRRAAKLHIDDVHQGVLDKLPVVRALCDKHDVAAAETCYIGDDLGDLDAMRFVGYPVAVRDAVPQIRAVARYVTRRRGGEGAVREVCDLILAGRAQPASPQPTGMALNGVLRWIVLGGARRIATAARAVVTSRSEPNRRASGRRNA